MMETSSRPRLHKRLVLLSTALIFVAIVATGASMLWRQTYSLKFPPDLFPEGISDSLRSDLIDAKQRVERNPGAASWGALGELCMAHELLPQATWCFQKASDQKPDEPKWIYLMGVMAEEVDLLQAIAFYDRVLNLDRSVAALHYRRGKALARVGRFEDAEQSLTTAANMSEQHPLVLKAMAQLSMMQGDSEGSLMLIQQAVNDQRAGSDIIEEAKRLQNSRPEQNMLSITPESESVSARPQVTHMLSETWLDGVARRLPQTAEVAAQAGTLASQQHYAAALEMYERLIRIDDRNARAHNFHAMVLMNAGNVQQALAEIGKVCEEFPQDALAFSSRGAIEARMGNFPAAIESLKEAVRLKPDFVDAHRALLMIFQLQKMQDDAEGQMKILETLAPSHDK